MVKVGRWFDYLTTVFAVVSGIIIIYLMISINYAVVSRAFFGRSRSWVVDVSGFSLVYITFLASAWVLKNEGHVKVEILLDRLSLKNRRIFNIATSALGTLLCIVFVWISLKITIDAIQLRAIYLSSLVFPKWPLLVVMPIGSLLLAVQFLRNTLFHIREPVQPESSG